MVTVVLLSVIILGLLAMFTQTQRAFRSGMTQVDVLEAGRMATDMIARELGGITPDQVSVNIAAPNFFAQMTNWTTMTLVGGSAARTNVLEDVFFLVHQNQTWTGIGYFVRTDLTFPGNLGSVGALYRFETNSSAAQFSQNPSGLFVAFDRARNALNPLNVSKIMDGVVHFTARAYETNGYWLSFSRPSGNILVTYNQPNVGELDLCYFASNAVPAAVEFELGILESQIYDRYKSIPVAAAQQSFYQNQAGHVHLFRQRIGIRNVDRTAYQ